MVYCEACLIALIRSRACDMVLFWCLSKDNFERVFTHRISEGQVIYFHNRQSNYLARLRSLRFITRRENGHVSVLRSRSTAALTSVLYIANLPRNIDGLPLSGLCPGAEMNESLRFLPDVLHIFVAERLENRGCHFLFVTEGR